MLQAGLIGHIENLESFGLRLQQNKRFVIIGKASTGIPSGLDSFYYSIPEFNRIELLERADVVLLDGALPAPFRLLTEMLKKSRHIFITGYPELNLEECEQLVKLADESGSVVQFYNPYYYMPAVHWLRNTTGKPVYLDVKQFGAEKNRKKELYKLLFMLLDIAGLNPKKVVVSAYSSPTLQAGFVNIRLEYSDASVASLNLGSSAAGNQEFIIESYSHDQFVRLNPGTSSVLCNHEKVEAGNSDVPDEYTSFALAIENRNRLKSGLDDYLAVQKLMQNILKKTNLLDAG